MLYCAACTSLVDVCPSCFERWPSVCPNGLCLYPVFLWQRIFVSCKHADIIAQQKCREHLSLSFFLQTPIFLSIILFLIHPLCTRPAFYWNPCLPCFYHRRRQPWESLETGSRSSGGVGGGGDASGAGGALRLSEIDDRDDSGGREGQKTSFWNPFSPRTPRSTHGAAKARDGNSPAQVGMATKVPSALPQDTTSTRWRFSMPLSYFKLNALKKKTPYCSTWDRSYHPLFNRHTIKVSNNWVRRSISFLSSKPYFILCSSLI